MDEEEKKAIERTQEHLTEMLKKYEMYNDQLDVRSSYRNGDIKIILNLIENQQKELTNIKEIEKSHREVNEKLRAELEQEKEINNVIAIKNRELKEKNNELEIELAVRDNIKVDKLVEKYRYYRKLANSYQANCISKDKLKELLENEIIDISGFRCIAVEDIKELLEEI